MLGAVITVPLILASGPFAGYLIGQYLLVNYFGCPEILVPIFIGLGLIGSGMQIFRIIQKIGQSDRQEKSKNE